MNQRLKTTVYLLSASLGAVPLATANLVLTEVDFDTNTIEITNLSESSFAGNELEWCVPFNYGALENTPFTFTAGETRIYAIPFTISATAGNDLWIYLNNAGSFSDESKVTTGVVWGSSQAGMGRTDQVVSESSAWAVNTDFVPTGSLPAGHTMQLLPGSPPSNTSASWTIAPGNFGSYGASASVELELRIQSGPGMDEVTLFWPTSTQAEVLLESSATLATDSWAPRDDSPTVVGENNELTLMVADAIFFRLRLSE